MKKNEKMKKNEEWTACHISETVNTSDKILCIKKVTEANFQQF